MNVPNDVARALYGAYRLALFDKKGHNFFDTSDHGFWRSFHVAFAIAPLYLVMLGAQAFAGLVEKPLGRYLALELSAYALSWLVFPVVMEWLSRTLGCRDKYVGFIVAYNWAMVPQYVLFIGILSLGLVGVIPMDVSQSLTTLIFFWTLIYAGFVIKTALEVPLMTTAGIIFLDLLLSLVLNKAVTG